MITSSREELADYAHQAWAGWTEYLFGKSVTNNDGSVTIPPVLVERWLRQMSTSYADLSEAEKDSDPKEADVMLAIVSRYQP